MNFYYGKGSKIEKLRELIPQSEAVKARFDITTGKWQDVLSDLSEEQIDELILMLEEELSMKKDVKDEEQRKLAISHSNYARVLEKLKLRAETLLDNQKQ
ncbi:hypothetical protein KKC94_02665 [Patescibacteria group bacterium]|nr:hypothetical protein [Patescibacteria group bacterium]